MTDTAPSDANPHDWSELMADATPETLARALLQPVDTDPPSS